MYNYEVTIKLNGGFHTNVIIRASCGAHARDMAIAMYGPNSYIGNRELCD